jgi:uncharacterized protein (DUF1501 family)
MAPRSTSNPTRCTDCEELQLARVSDARPIQTVPLPRAALLGLPEGRAPLDLTRRRLLQAGIAGFASVYGPRVLGWESIWESAVAEAAGTSNNCLVLLYLAGGNDGLNTIVPTASGDFGAYVGARPALHRQQGATGGGRVGCHPLAGPAGAALSFANPLVSTGGGGDNGASIGFDTLYGPGDGTGASNLAIMPSVDYVPPNLSHFESSDYWFSGALSQLSTGWLGRWLDIHGSDTNPLQAISLDSSISKAIRTSHAPVCSIPGLIGLGFSFQSIGGYGSPGVGYGNYVDANAQLKALAGVPAGSGNGHLARSRATFAETVDVYNSAHSLTPPAGGGLYPNGSRLASQLQLAATFLAAGLGTRIITIHWGSLDTHGNQLAVQDPQLVELSRCLGAFQADLATRGIDDRVSTLVFSEFGRRVAENASAGTDHGAGGLMLAMGRKVRGGWAAPFAGLSTLDSVGDLMVPTDFRSVYQAVLAEWFGTDPSEALPGTPAGGFQALARQDSSGSNALFDLAK